MTEKFLNQLEDKIEKVEQEHYCLENTNFMYNTILGSIVDHVSYNGIKIYIRMTLTESGEWLIWLINASGKEIKPLGNPINVNLDMLKKMLLDDGIELQMVHKKGTPRGAYDGFITLSLDDLKKIVSGQKRKSKEKIKK